MPLERQFVIQEFQAAWEELNTLSTADDLTSAERTRVRAARDQLNDEFRNQVDVRLDRRTQQFIAFAGVMQGLLDNVQNPLAPLGRIQAIADRAAGIIAALDGGEEDGDEPAAEAGPI